MFGPNKPAGMSVRRGKLTRTIFRPVVITVGRKHVVKRCTTFRSCSIILDSALEAENCQLARSTRSDALPEPEAVSNS